MNYLYVLIIISAAVFAFYTVFTQIRLNRHTDTQAKFLIAAKPYNFSPYKDMLRRAAKYLLLSAAVLLVLIAGAAAVYSITDGVWPDLILTAYAFGVSIAAYILNTVLLFFCAAAYVDFKIRYTPVL